MSEGRCNLADRSKKIHDKTVRHIPDRYRVERPKDFRMKDADPSDTAGLEQEDVGEDVLAKDVVLLAELQERLFAQDRWAVLLLFQAMDAAGKDSTIKHVLSGINPAGCQVFSFKSPGEEDLDHDYLWRHARDLPERGRIGVFNRSWYEEVLIARVHPEILARQRIPGKLAGKHVWEERFEDINNLELHLARNGTLVLKFFLHLSKEEQRKRFLARIVEPSKNWKFSLADAAERERWDDYMDAYEKMIRHTSTEHAPWHVVPADHKWFTRLAVASVVVRAIEELDPKYPKFDRTKRAELAEARRLLEREGRGR